MKKIITLFLLTLVFYPELSAQSFSPDKRITLYGSYTFDDSFDSYYDYGNYYQGKISDGMLYGVGFEFEIRPSAYLELSYLRESTNAPTQYYTGGAFTKYNDFDVVMNYIMLGANHSFQKSGSKVEGFGGLSLGMAIVDIEHDDVNPAYDVSKNVTKFAWGLKAGAIIWATPKFGVKLQAQLLSVAQSFGGGFYFGTGGSGAGVSTYSSIYQFSLGGGLTYNFN